MQSLMLLAFLFLLAQGPAGLVVPVTLNGHISVDDASPVPTVETFRGPNVLVGLQAIPADGTNQLAEATTNADGTFALTVTTAAGIGRFGIHVSRIPLGLYVKSMSYGSVDILQAPLDISRNHPPEEIRIVLTKTPPSGASGGVRLSGRVTKLENTAPGTSLMISLQTTSGASNQLRLGVFPLNADGTFEIRGVPSGRYIVRSQPGLAALGEFSITGQDRNDIEIALARPGTLSILITSDPMSPPSGGSSLPPRSSLSSIAQLAIPPTPDSGAALVSVTQTVSQLGIKYYEGAIAFYRVERAGEPIEEKRLNGAPAVFTLLPGSYELAGYFRGCDGNCGRLGAPEVFCSAPFTVKSGEVLYAERNVQNTACTIRIYSPQR
jgi:hypothetical protein